MSEKPEIKVGDRVHWRSGIPGVDETSSWIVDRLDDDFGVQRVHFGDKRLTVSSIEKLERRHRREEDGWHAGTGDWRTIWQRNSDLPVIDGLVARYDARTGACNGWIQSDLRSSDEPEIEFGDRVFDGAGYGDSDPITVDTIIKTGRLWGDTESGKRVCIHRSSVVKVERRREVRDRWGEVIAESDWRTVWQRDRNEWSMQGGWDRDGVGPERAEENARDEFSPGDRIAWDAHNGVPQGVGIVLRQNGRDVVVSRNDDGSQWVVSASALWKCVPTLGEVLRRHHSEPDRPRTYDDVAREVRGVAGPWLNQAVRSQDVAGLVETVERICGVKSARLGDDGALVWQPDTSVTGELKCSCGEHKVSPWDCHFPPTDMPRFRCVTLALRREVDGLPVIGNEPNTGPLPVYAPAPPGTAVGADLSPVTLDWSEVFSKPYQQSEESEADDDTPPALYLCARISPEGEGVDRHHRARWVDFEEVTNDERRAMVARLLPIEAVAEKPEHAVHKLLQASGIVLGDVRHPEGEWVQWTTPQPIQADWLDTKSRDGEHDPEFDIEVTL